MGLFTNLRLSKENTVITLADWYHTLAHTNVDVPYVTISLRFDILLTPFRVADSTLINGLGRNVKGPADAPLAVIGVESGKRCVNIPEIISMPMN